MRLANVERGGRFVDRLLYAIIRRLSGLRAPDVLRTMRYRAPMFGRPFSVLTQAVMRGPSEWTVGERELFAAYVSRVNDCPF
jgi:hypothetical protein